MSLSPLTEKVRCDCVQSGDSAYCIVIRCTGDGDRKSTQEKYMAEFFSAVEIVKQNIVVIRDSTKRIGDINQQVTAYQTTDE
jgi:hypothetical protein